MAEEAEARLLEGFDPERDPAVVVWSEDWHPGVIGIVASRLADKYGLPAVVITFDGDLGRGSARSAGRVNLAAVLDACAPLLERYGGHREAAGLDVRRERVEEFRERFLQEVASIDASGDSGDAGPSDLAIDLEITLGQAIDSIDPWMRHLEPFGYENPRPVLMARGIRFADLSRVGSGGPHLRATAQDEEAGRLQAIGFGMGDRAAELGHGSWEIAFELVEDHWQGRRRVQARLLDARTE